MKWSLQAWPLGAARSTCVVTIARAVGPSRSRSISSASVKLFGRSCFAASLRAHVACQLCKNGNRGPTSNSNLPPLLAVSFRRYVGLYAVAARFCSWAMHHLRALMSLIETEYQHSLHR